MGVVHRDLKLENVLLDGELKVKLGDLGFVREWESGRLLETFCGTTGYASPEMLTGKKYVGEGELMPFFYMSCFGWLSLVSSMTRFRRSRAVGSEADLAFFPSRRVRTEVDVWSMGIILYCLLCGGLPFDDDDEEVMKKLIIQGVYEEPEWLAEGTSPRVLPFLVAALFFPQDPT